MTYRTLRTMGVALAVAGALSGCISSPPTQFIALNSTTPDNAHVKLDGPPLRLGRIRLASALDRPYLVRETGPNTREVSNTVRWIAPLGGMIHDTLATDLADQLQPTSFITDVGDNQPARILSVFVQSLTAGADNRVHLDARWQVVANNNDKTTATPSDRNKITVRAASDKPGDIAAAMSRALAQLSVRIVAALDHES